MSFLGVEGSGGVHKTEAIRAVHNLNEFAVFASDIAKPDDKQAATRAKPMIAALMSVWPAFRQPQPCVPAEFHF
jgi:hypothetical protein